MKIKLLNIFAMVALVVGESKQTLFQDSILTVPKCRRQAQYFPSVTKPRNALFAPSVGITSGFIMVYKLPRRTVFTIIFANGAPLPFSQIRTPFFPVFIGI